MHASGVLEIKRLVLGTGNWLAFGFLRKPNQIMQKKSR